MSQEPRDTQLNKQDDGSQTNDIDDHNCQDSREAYCAQYGGAFTVLDFEEGGLLIGAVVHDGLASR
jgi:hypothetical protein